MVWAIITYLFLTFPIAAIVLAVTKFIRREIYWSSAVSASLAIGYIPLVWRVFVMWEARLF